MGTRFDRYASPAACAPLAPVLLVIAAGMKAPMPREPERPSLHVPLPLDRPNDVVVREHDETPSAPTRGVHVFDMV